MEEQMNYAIDAGSTVARAPLNASLSGHRAGQRILMFDGTIKPVEEVSGGDLLMGPDSQARAVLRLLRGRGRMYRVTPVKGQTIDATGNQVLTLVHTETGTLEDVTVGEWLSWSKNRRHLHKLLRCPIDFPECAPLPVDPYFLGVLLGDGSWRGSVSICKPDPEMMDLAHTEAERWGLKVRTESSPGRAPSHHLTARVRGAVNELVNTLRSLGVHGTISESKFVPHSYKTASRADRLGILAGLLDTDGSLSGAGYDFISKSRLLAADLVFIARSLGLAAYLAPCEKYDQNGVGGTYYRVSVSGDCSLIPCRIERKRAAPRRQKKSVLRTGFSVEQFAIEDYYGFSLDRDGRYLLDDFTVMRHSSRTIVASTPN
jgi:hypothetical protein